MKHRNSILGNTLGAMALLAMVLAPVGLAVAADLPGAEEVLSSYAKAIGGEKALSKIKNRIVKGKFSLPAMGIDATMEMYIEPPNFYNEVNIESMGMVVKTGISDGVVWQINPMQGSSIMEGAEKAGALQQADLEQYVNWKKHYDKAEVTGEEEVAEEACYVVVLTPKEGEPSTVYFSKESGLILQTTAVQQGMPVTAAVSDYKEIDGIKQPGKIATSGGQMDIEMVFDSIEQNVKIPDGTFDLPDEIKALQEGSDSAESDSAESDSAESDSSQ